MTLTETTPAARPIFAISTDVVIFTIHNGELQLLLVRGTEEPAPVWGLPSGRLGIGEHLDACAERALAEQTGVGGVYLEQLYTFGDPSRCPHCRVITVSYYALIPSDRARVDPGHRDHQVDWFSLANLPKLILDHDIIVECARERLVAKLDYSTIAFQFLPNAFTLSDLQSVYEIILGERLDKRNFRKRVLALDCLHETGNLRRDGSHRPARLYQLRTPGEVQYIK